LPDGDLIHTWWLSNYYVAPFLTGLAGFGLCTVAYRNLGRDYFWILHFRPSSKTAVPNPENISGVQDGCGGAAILLSCGPCPLVDAGCQFGISIFPKLCWLL